MLTWVSAEVAATWPEGIPVLERRRVKPADYWQHIVSDWHRPDWVENVKHACDRLKITVEWAKIETDENIIGEQQ